MDYHIGKKEKNKYIDNGPGLVTSFFFFFNFICLRKRLDGNDVVFKIPAAHRTWNYKFCNCQTKRRSRKKGSNRRSREVAASRGGVFPTGTETNWDPLRHSPGSQLKLRTMPVLPRRQALNYSRYELMLQAKRHVHVVQIADKMRAHFECWSQLAVATWGDHRLDRDSWLHFNDDPFLKARYPKKTSSRYIHLA